jgi:hypothetical protein
MGEGGRERAGAGEGGRGPTTMSIPQRRPPRKSRDHIEKVQPVTGGENESMRQGSRRSQDAKLDRGG